MSNELRKHETKIMFLPANTLGLLWTVLFCSGHRWALGNAYDNAHPGSAATSSRQSVTSQDQLACGVPSGVRLYLALLMVPQEPFVQGKTNCGLMVNSVDIIPNGSWFGEISQSLWQLEDADLQMFSKSSMDLAWTSSAKLSLLTYLQGWF